MIVTLNVTTKESDIDNAQKTTGTPNHIAIQRHLFATLNGRSNSGYRALMQIRDAYSINKRYA